MAAKTSWHRYGTKLSNCHTTPSATTMTMTCKTVGHLGAAASSNNDVQRRSTTKLRCRFIADRIFLPLLLLNKKGKVFPYSLPSVGPGADPGVQAVSPQVT